MTNMHEMLKKQKEFVLQQGAPSIDLRIDRLNRMKELILDYRYKFVDAHNEDFGVRSKNQSMITDAYSIIPNIEYAKKNIKSWTGKSKRKTSFPFNILGARSYVEYEPLGVVGMISPWNFPVNLTFSPLIAVFAAGNVVMHKPSEYTENTSALLKESCDKYFDDTAHDIHNDASIDSLKVEELDDFKGFLRQLIMHGAVGTALGGVCTIVGEPQNLLIANIAGWDFIEFFLYMAPVTMPVFVAGLLVCFCLERFKLAGFGSELSGNIRTIFAEYAAYEDEISKNDDKKKAELAVELFVLVLLIFALAFHIAEVGIIGLGVIILLTSFKGITHEHYLGDAFKEALPFTALLCVFFAIVSVIHEQHLFTPVINYVLTFSIESQTSIFFIANGVLSAISDNVFVATIYINEVKALLDAGKISLEHFNNLTIAINTGTNIPSIATPNGQAAFLFLLTSSLAPLINLSYFRMVLMALPYTIVLTIVALISVYLFI